MSNQNEVYCDTSKWGGGGGVLKQEKDLRGSIFLKSQLINQEHETNDDF